LIDNNYNGKLFKISYLDAPKKRADLVQATYEVDIPEEPTKIAVKIIDMLGEEIIIDKQV